MKKRNSGLIMLIVSVLLFLLVPVAIQADSHEDLIISEYVEGSSYNKAIELYNGTGSTIDLSEYTIVNFANGASQEPGDGNANALSLSGTLNSGDTFVIANERGSDELLAKADLTGSSYFYGFNGDDAIVLFKNYDETTRQGVAIDRVGVVGEDPGSYWGNNDAKTQNMTLVRDVAVTQGNTDLTSPFSFDEWIAFYSDTFEHLGSHNKVEPPSNEVQEEYEATVERVVDGDTIKIQQAILGTTTIRFLNIDTPETYHLDQYDSNLINEDPNHSQKYHGDQATKQLASYIQPGDKVILKMGAEPLDTYGRLLAEVVRKSDGLNTNKEMVRNGYAATYFIWPIGDQTTYEEYQQIQREAINQGNNMWSQENPLMELPFEFRARYDGRALYRYPGNSETKEYFMPDDWKNVPIDKRIFFPDEMSALNEGYQPAFDREPIIADARAASVGTNVMIEGTITHKINQSGKTNYYVQDETAGIVVRTDQLNANVGDHIRAAGVTNEYYDMLQVEASSAEVIGEGTTVEPTVITSDQIGEELEAQLVQLEDVEVLSVNQYNDYTVKDASGEFIIDNDAGFLQVGETYDTIIGVLDYNFGAFKVMPRDENDLLQELPITSLQEVRDSALDTRVHFEGVVTAAFAVGGSTNYYVQDDSAGIVVRLAGSDVEVGDKVRVKGRTEEYFGLLQVQPTLANTTIVEKNSGVPAPKVVTSSDLGESLEGQLVQMNNVSVESVDNHANYQASDDQGAFVIDSYDGFVETGKTYESVTGVVTYNYDEYKLMPRNSQDVVEAVSLLDGYVAGEKSIAQVTDSLLEMASEKDMQTALSQLKEELTTHIQTNGNTEQHIKSAIKHIEKAMIKYQNNGKDSHYKKIGHEIEKLFKRMEKQAS
ncbi:MULTISPECIES: thermonuclease family protein [Allobacillus]|uniref:Endonuclease n=1 Tax=Allobacillus salarius TaxID=1955272 RepID=A0A556PH32_9BACI|nr:thermonuclease family protein [Allobacillus salarius]TSJ63683.1 hypothetical protein FPQ13_08790 [Allobacillus salarius]